MEFPITRPNSTMSYLTNVWHPVDEIVRHEPNLDRACDDAQREARRMFGVDDDGEARFVQDLDTRRYSIRVRYTSLEWISLKGWVYRFDAMVEPNVEEVDEDQPKEDYEEALIKRFGSVWYFMYHNGIDKPPGRSFTAEATRNVNQTIAKLEGRGVKVVGATQDSKQAFAYKAGEYHPQDTK